MRGSCVVVLLFLSLGLSPCGSDATPPAVTARSDIEDEQLATPREDDSDLASQQQDSFLDMLEDGADQASEPKGRELRYRSFSSYRSYRSYRSYSSYRSYTPSYSGYRGSYYGGGGMVIISVSSCMSS